MGRTPHPDQSLPFSSMEERSVLTRPASVRFREGLPSHASWRNENAAVCKTAMSGVSTRRRIHFSVAKSLSWLEWRGARLLNGFTRVRILPRAPVWRVNPPGRGRRLLSARCGNACESCSQLSAKLVSADLGHWLIARLPSVAKGVRFLQSAPTCLGMILSENRAPPRITCGAGIFGIMLPAPFV